MNEHLARELYFAALASGMTALTEKQQFVIGRSWGLGGIGPYSFREIADCMGIGHQRVHRIYERGMESLRRELGVEGDS